MTPRGLSIHLGLAIAVLDWSPAPAALVRSYLSCRDGSLPPPSQPCPPLAFVVFFEPGRSDITSQAGVILVNTADEYRQHGRVMVVISGHADRAGSEGRNLALSRRRAEAVLQYLYSRDVPKPAMRIVVLGESRPLVKTADGVAERFNRRVEISFEPYDDR